MFFMQQDFVKITEAVYRVLEFLPDDVLKTRAKQQALAVLEAATRKKPAPKLHEDIEVLENYLKLAKHCGWISDINFLILSKEYGRIQAGLGAEITNYKPKITNKPQIPNQNIKSTQTPVGDFSERQTKIIDILKKKEKAQVADLIKQLPRITKRTIRRDLDVLLKEKAVVRVGEFNQVFYRLPVR